MTKAQKALDWFKSLYIPNENKDVILEILAMHDKLVEAVVDISGPGFFPEHIADKHAETIAYCQKEKEQP